MNACMKAGAPHLASAVALSCHVTCTSRPSKHPMLCSSANVNQVRLATTKPAGPQCTGLPPDGASQPAPPATYWTNSVLMRPCNSLLSTPQVRQPVNQRHTPSRTRARSRMLTKQARSSHWSRRRHSKCAMFIMLLVTGRRQAHKPRKSAQPARVGGTETNDKVVSAQQQ